jgi:hypothetical protein
MALINFLMLLVLLALLWAGSGFLAEHQRLLTLSEKAKDLLPVLASLLVVALVGQLLARKSLAAGGVRLSPTQFPEVYDILRTHSARAGLKRLPELYFNQSKEGTIAISTPKFDVIALNSDILEHGYDGTKDELAFLIGREIGRIALGQASLWYLLPVLLVEQTPFLKGMLSITRTLSLDRCGATLAPQGARGILLLSAGVQAFRWVNLPELVQQVNTRTDFWEMMATLSRGEPMAARRFRALLNDGFLSEAELPPPTAPTSEARTEPARKA